MSNFIFASQDDAIRYAIRKIYHDVLHREIESVETQNFWLAQWHQNGGDLVLAGIMDSPEGQQAIAAERRLLGI
jgi:hypothetical protein